MLALPVTIYVIFTVEMCMTVTLTFRIGRKQCKYASEMVVCNFVFVGNSNVCPICHRLWDIINRNVHDLDLWDGPRSNVNMQVKRPYATFCIGNLLPWKWRSRMLSIWKKIDRRTYVVNWHMYAKLVLLGVITVQNRTFCDRRTNERINILPARITLFQLLRNNVKMNGNKVLYLRILCSLLLMIHLRKWLKYNNYQQPR